MGNIITYLNEFGNVSLRKMPFNEIDNLVLCTLAYNNFENIIPENAEYSISVKKAAKLFVKMKHHSFIPKTEQILFKMSCKRRFSRAKLFNYVNFVDSNIGIQFCAFHILLNDKTTFIVFRGTDESLTGWKESFCISCENIPSCHAAAKYLKTTMKPGKIYRIGGTFKRRLSCRSRLYHVSKAVTVTDNCSLLKRRSWFFCKHNTYHAPKITFQKTHKNCP